MKRETSLIPIDSSKIRKAAIRDLKSTIKKIEKAKENITLYQKEVKPAFLSWYQTELKPLIAKMEVLESKYNKKEKAVLEVFAYAEFYQIPPALAYVYIQERNNTPEAEREFDPFFDKEEKGYWEEDEEDEEDDPFYGEEPRFDWNTSHDSDMDNGEGRSEDLKSNKKSILEELTTLFHSVARFLHPDKNKEQTDEEKEQWIVALEMYNEKNIEGLKDTLTWIRIRREETGDEVSVGELRSLIEKFKKDLKLVQKDVRSYKKYPDWEFTKKSKPEKNRMKKEFTEELQSDYIRMHYEMEKLDRIIYSWKEYRKGYSSSPRNRFL
jgi:hypothetical protein